MRPISSVAWGPNRIDLFGLGMDNQVFHKGWDGTVWAGAWEPLGGVFTSSIAAVSRGPKLLDLFGLGTDYSMFHRSFDGTAWAAGWEGLGGVFTSPPAVVSMAPNRVDVFGLAADHSLVHRWWDGHAWSANWESLGGNFTSQPEVVTAGPNQLDVFAVGADFAMHHRSWRSTGWSQWESLGGTFISQPAVAAWTASPASGTASTSGAGAPTSAATLVSSQSARLTVFGLGTDNAMYFRTSQGGAWPANWESLGGSFSGPPALVSWGPNRLDVFGVGTDTVMYHKAWAGGWDANWTSLGGLFTSPPAVVAWGPNRLDVFGLGTDYSMFHKSGDGKTFGSTWERQEGRFELPGTFRFSLDSFEIDNTRSVHDDTDYVSVTVTVGARPPQTLTKSMGDLNNGNFNVGLAFTPVNVDLSDFVIFTYVILNKGHATDTIEQDLTKAANTLAGKGVQAASAAIGQGLAGLIGAEIGSAALPVIGTVLGEIAGWLVGNLTGIIFADCDGPVAAEQAALTGVQLRSQTLKGALVSQHTTHPGAVSNSGCGGNSLYKSSWSYQPVNHP